MELMQAIEKRRTVRDFSDKPIPEEAIRKALYAGLKAPSYNHLKQVYFTLVKDPALRLALTIADAMPDAISQDAVNGLQKEYEKLASDMYIDAIPKQKKMVMTAPEVLVIAYKPKIQISDANNPADVNCHAAAWACIENILLSLAEDDIYATTMVPSNTPAIKRVLNIPTEYEVTAIIPLGYKAPGAKIIPQKDVSVDAALHIDRWE